MNRSHIIKEVSRFTADRRDADSAVRAAFEAMREALRNGEKVVISGFGTFSSAMRPAKECRNPKTGEKVSVGPRRTVRFKPARGVFER